MLLLSNTGGRTFPSLAGTREAQLLGVGVKWLMGKGQSRDIFGTRPPPTHPLGHTMEMCRQTTNMVLPLPTGVAGRCPQSPGHNAEALCHL